MDGAAATSRLKPAIAFGHAVLVVVGLRQHPGPASLHPGVTLR